MTQLPIVTVGFDGSLGFTVEQPLSRAQGLKLAEDLIHGHAESRGLDAVKGIASELPDEAYIFIFGEFVKVASSLIEHAGTKDQHRWVIQWWDDGFLNEVSIAPDTELWYYVPAQG